MVSRHEEEAPASAYLRTVPKCVAGFVYTERGKSTKDTVNSIAITAHTHTITYLHSYVRTHAHMHRRTHTMVIQHFASLQLQIWNFHEHMHKHHLPLQYIKTQMWSKTFLWHFFLLSVWSFKKRRGQMTCFDVICGLCVLVWLCAVVLKS